MLRNFKFSLTKQKKPQGGIYTRGQNLENGSTFGRKLGDFLITWNNEVVLILWIT